MVAASEPWAEAILDDGTVVRVRLVIGKVLVLDGSDDLGGPLVVVQSSTVVSASRPAAEPG